MPNKKKKPKPKPNMGITRAEEKRRLDAALDRLGLERGTLPHRPKNEK